MWTMQYFYLVHATSEHLHHFVPSSYIAGEGVPMSLFTIL